MPRVALIMSGLNDYRKVVYIVGGPYGLLCLAAWLQKQHPEVEIKIFDLMIRKQQPEDLVAELKEFNPDLVGIGAMHFQAYSLHGAARVVKEHLKAPVVVGGAYPSTEPGLALRDKNIDLAVIGEGELTFCEIYEKLAAGQPLLGIRGTAHMENGKLTLEPPREFIEDLDRLPIPNYFLVDIPAYWDWSLIPGNEMRIRREIASIFTSRACPYGCIYCHNLFGKKFRPRSPENVMTEIKYMVNNGVRELYIIDDCFNFDMERAKKILRMIIDARLDLILAFPNGIRGDRLDQELLDLMKKAGTYKVNLGIESGSPRIQSLIRKGLDLDQVGKNIEWFERAGIFTHGYFMMGFPGETKEELEQTINWAASSRLDLAGFAFAIPFPGTRLRELAEEQGKCLNFDAGAMSFAHAACNMTDLSDEELDHYHRLAHWRFYPMRPFHLLRVIWKYPNKWLLFKIFWPHFRLKFLGW